VVFLHGLLVGSLAEWYFTSAPSLAAHRRAILYDLRGHGRSDRPLDGYSIAEQTLDLTKLLDALGVTEPVGLVGHSFGALVALRFALDRPDSVERLALVDAPLPPSTLGEYREPDEAGKLELLGALPEEQRKAFLGGGRRARRLLEHLDFLTRQCSLMADLALEQDIPDGELAGLSMPVLGVFGARSLCRPVGQRLARVVPGFQHVELDCGHFVPLEASADLTAHLQEFFRG